MHGRPKPSGLSRLLRSRLVEALFGALFLAAILAPRVGIEVHSHGGGEHAHVHFAPGAARDVATSSRVPIVALPAPDGAPGFSDPQEPEHLHAFAPFMHSVASEPISLAIATALLWLAARAALAAPRRSLVTAQARAPPLSSRI